MDTVYIERANGRWEMWLYADGRRHFLGRGWRTKVEAITWARGHGYRIIEVAA